MDSGGAQSKPELLVAQTGFMQGAAGMGMWLFTSSIFERRRKPRLRFRFSILIISQVKHRA